MTSLNEHSSTEKDTTLQLQFPLLLLISDNTARLLFVPHSETILQFGFFCGLYVAKLVDIERVKYVYNNVLR